MGNKPEFEQRARVWIDSKDLDREHGYGSERGGVRADLQGV